MKPRNVTATLAALVGMTLTSCLRSQPAAGSIAPSIELKKLFNGSPPSLEEMRGSVVLLDYFATW